ncbi:cyclic nucleotide-binding domain-containing protein [Candidatus Manganitrophus noduliformans]|uniref:Cyclic nucleotide-binding domain-containing protein n=1 Tax=Candidatus Manganitrophus noduliformans TaxID=2606439 RepID=A0A7X6DM72_9BACT|nr:cyclic nucleotide-binding domain-containing protein [Candidatus Manganitrophus noduliformans]NKE69796.1 cyclic nucleotide-binding domain-containing protein [Candidatus Manganitrophus noduliformans]
MPAQKESRDALNEALHLCIKKSQWSEAIEILKKLMKLEPTNTMYLLRVGDYSAKIGAKKEAVTAYLSAGDTFSKNGFLVKAIAAYKMILHLEPDHPEARKRLQTVHSEARGQTDPMMILKTAPAAPSDSAAVEASPPESIPSQPKEAPPFEIERTSLSEEAEPSPEAAPSPVAKKFAGDAIPLFANLTPEEFASVIEGTTPRSYPPGAFIVREGETGNSIYIIVKGRAKAATKVGGQEIVLGFLNESDFFGEVAFLTGRPRTADVVTVHETDLLELPGESVSAILAQYPHIRSVLERLYIKRMQITIDAMKSAKGAL